MKKANISLIPLSIISIFASSVNAERYSKDGFLLAPAPPIPPVPIVSQNAGEHYSKDGFLLNLWWPKKRAEFEDKTQDEPLNN